MNKNFLVQFVMLLNLYLIMFHTSQFPYKESTGLEPQLCHSATVQMIY